MELFQAGILISSLRLERGWTQELLCKGICGRRNLIRIEKGEHIPELFTFTALMQRLGEDPAKYYSGIVTIGDKMLMDLDERLTNLLRKKEEEFDREAEILIAKHEEVKSKSKSYSQVLLSHKATLAFNRKDYLNAYNYAISGIKITNPDFDETEADTYIYTSQEIELVNAIAASQYYNESWEHSVGIYLKLKASIDKNYLADNSKQKNYMHLLYNLSRILGLHGKHSESLSLCNEGVELSKNNDSTHFLSLFLFNKAVSLFYTEQKEEGIQVMSRAYTLFLCIENYAHISNIRSFLESEFGISLTDIYPKLHFKS